MRFNSEIVLHRSMFLIIGLAAFVTLKPFFAWYDNQWAYILILHFILFIFFCLVTSYKFEKKSIIITLISLFLAFLYTMAFDSLLTILQRFIVYICGLSPFLLLRKDHKVIVFNYFVRIVALSYIPAIITAVILFIGIDLPFHTIQSPFESKPFYKQFLFSTVYAQYYGQSEAFLLPWGGTVDRVCAMFPEPGVVGTVSGLILVIRKFDFKNKSNVVIFIGGLLSISFAFYLITILFVLMKFNRFRGLFLLVMICMVIPFIPEDSYVYQRIIKRFTFEDGEWIGNNRNNEGSEYIFKIFNESDIKTKLFGMGYSDYRYLAGYYNGSSLSWKSFVPIFGYLLFYLHTIFYVIILWSYRRNFYLLFFGSVFLASSIFQRPYEFQLAYWLLFFGGIYYLVIQQKWSEDI